MAVAWVANGTAFVTGNGTNPSSVTSVLTVAGGTNNVLVVGVIVTTARTISSVVWDPTGANQALTVAGATVASTGSIGCKVALYTLINPTPGASKNVVATFDTIANNGGIISAHFQGVDQTTPIRAGSYNTNTASTSTTPITITSQTDDVTVTAGVGDSDDSGPVSTDKTIIGHAGIAGNGPCMGLDRAAGAATVTHTWSNLKFSATCAVVGGSLAAAGAGAPANWGRMLSGELNRLVRRI